MLGVILRAVIPYEAYIKQSLHKMQKRTLKLGWDQQQPHFPSGCVWKEMSEYGKRKDPFASSGRPACAFPMREQST